MKNFGRFCGSNDRDYIVMTAPAYGDIIHPVQFSEITLANVQHDSKVSIVFYHYIIMKKLFLSLGWKACFHEVMNSFIKYNTVF